MLKADPVSLNLVCLRACSRGLDGSQLNAFDEQLLNRINATGCYFLTIQFLMVDGCYGCPLAAEQTRTMFALCECFGRSANKSYDWCARR